MSINVHLHGDINSCNGVQIEIPPFIIDFVAPSFAATEQLTAYLKSEECPVIENLRFYAKSSGLTLDDLTFVFTGGD